MLARGRPVALLNVMIERVAYRPLRNAPKLAPLITAIGMSFILQNVGLLWAPARRTARRTDLLADRLLHDLTHRALRHLHGSSLVVIVTVPLLVGLLWFVGRTKYGKAMRATAQDMAARSWASTSTARSR